MDYSNESYVRLYVRDTTTWKRLPWQGKALLPLLLRKVDRAGVVALEGMDPAAVVTIHTELPREVVDVGLPKLLELGVVVVTDRGLGFPKFIKAQGASKTNAQRQREFRDRHRSETLDLGGPDTDPGQECNDSLQPVTPSNGWHSTAQHSTESSSSQNSDARAEPARFRRPVGDPPGDLAPPEPPLTERIATEHERRFGVAMPGCRPTERNHRKSAAALADWCERSAEGYQLDPQALATKVLGGLFASEKAHSRRWPLSWAAHDPFEYAGLPAGCKPLQKAVAPVERELAHPTHKMWTKPDWMVEAERAELEAEAAQVRQLFAVPPPREVAS